MSISPTPSVITAHFLRLQEDAQVAVALYDDTDHLRYANRTFRVTFGLAQDEVITWADLMRRNHATRVGLLISSPDIEAWIQDVSSRRGKVNDRSFEMDLCNGRWMSMTETFDATGWMLCVANDISHLKASERGLRQAHAGAVRAAQTDVLTGISNRAHILQQLDMRLDLLRERQQACGIVVVDLDHFKSVNDTYGHHGGDAVLRHFASSVSAVLRRGDGFGRLGGEEFMLLFPAIDAPGLERIVGRIVQGVRQSRPLPEHPGFAYTCSAGLRMLQPNDNALDAYRLADEALYAAKASGRDRLMWA